MHSQVRRLTVVLFALCLAVPAFGATPAPAKAPDSDAWVSFVARGARVPPAALSATPTIHVDCSGVACSAGDFDGNNALGAGDIGIWLHNFFAGPPYNLTYDLDGSGDLGANDLAVWLCLYFSC